MLQNREVIANPPDKRDKPQHERQQADDTRRISKKFAEMLQARENGDETWRSDVARRFKAWCLEKSWVMCLECHRLEKRPCHEADIRGTRRNHTIKQ